MSDDLVKRLRSQKAVDGRPHEIEQLTDEAAALIEQKAARIAALEAQIAAAAPAVDAQPVAEVVGTEAVSWVRVIKNGLRPGDKLYASAQSEGLRKDAWHPIETAPKDGTPLILFARAKHATASAPVIGWWIPDLGWIESAFSPNHPVGIVPSHWMPRPDFPAQQDPQ